MTLPKSILFSTHLFPSTETGRTYARYITRQGIWGGASGVPKKED